MILAWFSGTEPNQSLWQLWDWEGLIWLVGRVPTRPLLKSKKLQSFLDEEGWPFGISEDGLPTWKEGQEEVNLQWWRHIANLMQLSRFYRHRVIKSSPTHLDPTGVFEYPLTWASASTFSPLYPMLGWSLSLKPQTNNTASTQAAVDTNLTTWCGGLKKLYRHPQITKESPQPAR